MDIFLGLIGVVVWIVFVIGLAAGVTWVVVNVLPGGEKPGAPDESAKT